MDRHGPRWIFKVTDIFWEVRVIPWIKGKTAQQAHVALPEGTCEEEFARSGFFGRYAHLYRSAAPVGWTRIEGDLRPRAWDLSSAAAGDGERWLAMSRPLLGNADVCISAVVTRTAPGHFFRNADSDEVFFVHKGVGLIETDFGPLRWEKGDWVSIPRGTTWRLVPHDETFLLRIESASEFNFPDKGMLGQHALFDPAVLEVPEPPLDASKQMSSLEGQPVNSTGREREWEVVIQRCGRPTSVWYPFCPLNTVGWKGTLAPWRLNVRDIRPVVSDRYHLPPSAHTTLVADQFVVCTFLPRPLENGDAQAVKVPFYHSNIDFDEVLFYHDGDFFSRSGIGAGMMTFHPQGIHHGPHPQAVASSKTKTHTNEVAVMIDTRRPLEVLSGVEGFELQNYWNSWRQG